MSIHFTTENPQSLLNDFDARIHQAAATGKITTWKKSADGNTTRMWQQIGRQKLGSNP